jgi:hypothetical protein
MIAKILRHLEAKAVESREPSPSAGTAAALAVAGRYRARASRRLPSLSRAAS